MANQERDPRAYELMTVFIPELSEEDNQAQIEKVSTYITNAGGSLTETLTSSPWGRRRLAYTIRFNGVDYRDGFYTVYHFDSAPSFLTELERDLKLDTSTMRYLLVHDDPKAGEKFTGQEGEEATEGESASGETTEAAGTAAAAASTAAEQTASAAPQAEEAAATDAPAGEPMTTEAPAEEAPDEEAPAEAADESAEAPAENAGEAESTDTTSEEEAESDDESSEKE